jgi:enoyl-CoA hydratase
MKRYVSSSEEDGIVTLTLDDPERRNVLSEPLCDALIDAIAQANQNPEARALVIIARGTAFCAGAHLDDLRAAANGDTRVVRKVYQAFMDVADSPLPTIAAINGAAVGAGLNLALACDVRIAAQSARFDTRFLDIGLHPGGGHAWMLLRAAGWQHAANLLLLGQPVDANEALRIGLISACVPDGQLDDAWRAACRRACRTPRALMLRTKATLRHAATASHAAAFERETAEQMWSMQQAEFLSLLARTSK